MRWDALEDILDGHLGAPGIKEIADAMGEYASAQLSASTAAIRTDISPYISYQRELEELKASIEAEQVRAREELERLSLMVETATVARTSHLAGLFDVSRESTMDSIRRSMLDLDPFCGNTSAGAAAAAYGLSDLLPADLYGASAVVNSLKASALQAGLSDAALSGNASLTMTGLNSLSTFQSLNDSVATSTFHKSYLDDLRESLLSFQAQEKTSWQTTNEAVFEAARLRTIGEAYSSKHYKNEDEIKRLIARHGPQFTMRQALLLEATAHTAEKLLSIRNRRKIARKLSYISYMASSGSKILLSYVWLLLLMWGLLDSDLSNSPQLRSDRVRRSIKCLSPPPDQPLSKTPKVKPNAPNIAA